MSIFTRPLALTANRHEPVPEGQLITPDVLPLSRDKANLLELKDDGYSLLATDLLSQMEQILSVTDNKLKSTLTLRLNSATNVLELRGANGALLGEVRLPVVPGLPVAVEILKDYTPPDGSPVGAYMHLKFRLDSGKFEDIYYNVSALVDVYTIRVGERVLGLSGNEFYTELSLAVDGNDLLLRGKDAAEVSRITLPFSGETLTLAEFLRDYTPPPPHGASAPALPESNYLHLHFDAPSGERDMYIDFGELIGSSLDIWGKRVDSLPIGEELDALLADMPVGAFVYSLKDDAVIVFLTPEEGDARYVWQTGDQGISGIKTFGVSPIVPTPQVGDSSDKAATTKFVADAIAGFKTDDDVKLEGDQSVAGVKTFTDSPLVPTPVAGDASTKVANTQFVATAIEAAVANADEFVRLRGDQTVNGVKIFDASPQVPTAPEGDNTANAASTQFVTGAIARAHASAPTLVRTGGDQVIDGKKTFLEAPVVPTQSYTDSSTRAASTAFVHAALQHVAVDASNAVMLEGDQSVAGVKTFTDSPVVPTPEPLDSSGKVASTEFVLQTKWAVRGTPATVADLPLGALIYDPATPDNPEVYLTPQEADERYLLKTDDTIATKAYVDDALTNAGLDDVHAVTLDGEQVITGVKTFDVSPLVPTVATNDKSAKVASTQFVANSLATMNAVQTTGDQSISGTKTFGSSPVIPTPAAGDNSNNAASTAFVISAIADNPWVKAVDGPLPEDVSAIIADMPVGAIVISED